MKHYKPSGGKAKKRLLALVLALALVCSSLMSVYANGVATMDAGFGMDSGFGVDVQLDDDFGVDMQIDDDFGVSAQDEDEGADLDLAPGVTERVDANGNIVYEWGESTWNQWDNEQVSPYPDGEQMDPGFAIPTNTYRFWLTNDETKRAAADVEIASAMKLYDMTAYDATEMYGPLYGMYTLVAIADGGTMSDNTVLNPTSADAPDASKPYFAGWYTVDEFGYEQEFLFDHSTVSVAKSATVDVFAKWTAAKSGEAAQPNEDLAAEQTYERWFAQLISCSDSAFNDLIDRYLQDAGFEAWLNNLPEDEIQYLSDRMDSFVETLDVAKSDAHSLDIAQGGSETVAVSNMSEGLTYTGAPSGITVEQTTTTGSWGTTSYTGYKVSVGSSVKAGTYTLTVKYKYTVTSWSGWSSTTTTYDVTDTVTVTVTEAAANFTITNNMVNTEVAYIDFKPAQSTSTTLTPVENGVAVKGSGSNGEGVLAFFIKPKDGYLLTEFVNAAGADCDLYSVTVSAGNSMIQYFRDNSTAAQAVLDVAKAQGYLGYYGFSYKGTTYAPATYSTKAERPQMTVTAEANKTTGVKPGDTVTYTVTITPGHTSTGVDEVTGVTINSLTINGQTADYSTLTKNDANGTYTTTVTHVVTDADWASGDVKLVVEASVDYSYTITVKDRGLDGKVTTSTIPSEATVPNTAEVSVQVAPKTRVVYSVTYDPDDLTPPDIIKTAPSDTAEYFAGDSVTVNSTYGTENPATGEPANKVDDSTNGGTWTFDGWYKDEALTQKASATEKMPENGLFLYGKWTFEKYPNTTVTITKNVTGIFGERSTDFDFEVTFDCDAANITAEHSNREKTVAKDSDGKFTFTLKHEEKITFSNVPIDAKITVTETGTNDYEVSVTVDGGEKTVGNTITHTVLAPDSNGNAQNNIVVTNHKNGLVDAGIDLGSATPYLFLLCVGAVGVATLKRKRRS